MHWVEVNNARVNIGKEMESRGWTIHGYRADESDPMTDYYSPASWRGVATSDRHPGIVVGVKTSSAAFGQHQDIISHDTPKGCAWHIEQGGKIVATGTGLSRCAAWNRDLATEACKDLVDKIERKVSYLVSGKTDTVSDGATDVEFRIKHETKQGVTWTWIEFNAKPAEQIRDRLKLKLRARWSKRRGSWYVQERVSELEVKAALDGDDAEFERIRDGRYLQEADQAMEVAAGIA